ncbi:MAG: cysteine--tRNA ligase [bacterium]
MPLTLFDTLSRSSLPLLPADGKMFRLYCCGPTVYGPAHIGNFRTFVMQDVLRRTLEAGGLKTKHVRNITDVDDKTIRQSQAEKRSLAEFTSFWRERFHRDCKALNLLPPHVEPSAVEHIPQQIQWIERLITSGHAYVKTGSVYFKVSSFPTYGGLSRLKEREITTTHRESCDIEDADEYERDSAADFALWKARKPEDGDNFWNSPWGEGRPGWHIECTAMSTQYLGETIDLHSGGADLCFPHHENEIAQTEAITGKPFARHWFHIAHLLVEGKKMSKSLGNLYTLDDVQKWGHTAMEMRYVLLSGHYRQPLNFTKESLQAVHSALEKMAKFDAHLRQVGITTAPTKHGGAFEKAWEVLNDDLNTPEALGQTFSAMKEVEAQLRANALKDTEQTIYGWSRMMAALGLTFPSAKENAPAPPEIQQLAEQRWLAKQAKDWAKADELRKKIAEAGWIVQDKQGKYELVPTFVTAVLQECEKNKVFDC